MLLFVDCDEALFVGVVDDVVSHFVLQFEYEVFEVVLWVVLPNAVLYQLHESQ